MRVKVKYFLTSPLPSDTGEKLKPTQYERMS